jgi:hypothetical protein
MSVADQEAELDDIIDRVLVLSDNPDVEDALILRLQYDIAAKIHLPEEIVRRYGLPDLDALKEYLVQHPQVVFGAKKLRALFESGEGVEARMRAKFQFATEDCIPVISQLVNNPSVPFAARIDGFKQLQRGAGADGAGRAEGRGPLSSGQSFVLNIFLDPKHRTTISGTTVDNPGDIPGAYDPPRLALGEEGEEPDEEADV